MKTTTEDFPQTNLSRAEEIAVRALSDVAGAFVSALGYLGDQLGLFKALADGRQRSSMELAAEAKLDERYVREWLKAMVAAEYIEAEPGLGVYWMTPDQAAVLGDEGSPFFVGGLFQFSVPSIYNVPRLLQTFRTGGGIPYDEIGSDVHCAIERSFAPGYRHQLPRWLGAVPGLVERLESGARVADVGCGRGQSTVHLAAAFPKASIVGLDYHGHSIAAAMKLAADRGLQNVQFKQRSTEDLAAEGQFDLICAFDTIHDMADPVEGLRAIRRALTDDGALFWCEPNASHEPLENRNPLGKFLHAVSPMHCMTVSLAHNGAGLGTVIGEKGARELAEAAGFGSFRRVPVDDPMSMFFEVRK